MIFSLEKKSSNNKPQTRRSKAPSFFECLSVLTDFTYPCSYYDWIFTYFFQTPLTSQKNQVGEPLNARLHRRMIIFSSGSDTIFINCDAANILSKMPYANGEEYRLDSSQLQVNVRSVAVVMLL